MKPELKFVSEQEFHSHWKSECLLRKRKVDSVLCRQMTGKYMQMKWTRSRMKVIQVSGEYPLRKVFFLRRTFLFFSYSFPNYSYHRFLLFLIVIRGDAVSISRKNGAERDRVISKAFSSAKPVVGLHGSDLFLSVKFRPKNQDGKSEIAVSGSGE